ncbi:RAP domain protein [Theileria parva strain Muguga]|uniref:RAP domain protein n=1 Tax=Theileria parva strain Muguga TaxID=333668 RepID=UPI001C61E361|nr:RAP domain protein [Theileria parva strain Muguga]EAN32417.2 RAP domain protein [Theileria parva strain Muguga]
MNRWNNFCISVKYFKYYTFKNHSSYRIIRIPIEDKTPLNFKLINEKLLEPQELSSSSRTKLLDVYDAVSDLNVKKILDDVYYNKLVEQTSHISSTLIPEDYAKIFNKFRQFPKITSEYVQSLNLQVQRLSKNFTTKQIAILLRSYAHLKSRSVKTIADLVETFNKKFNDSEVWELRELASALASLNIPYTGHTKTFFDQTVSILPKSLKTMDPNDIAIFVNSFARLRVPHNEILHFIEMNSNRIVNNILPKNFSLILNSFAKNIKYSDGLMDSCSKKLVSVFSDTESDFYNKMNVIDVSIILNSFSKLEYFDHKLFNLFIPWLMEKINGETKTLSLVLLVHAYSQAGVRSKDLFSKIAHQLIYRVSNLNPQQLGLVSLSYAKIGYSPSLLFHRIADEIIYRGTIGLKYERYDFDFQSLEQITQAFSRIGFKDKRVFSVLTTLLKSRLKNHREEISGEMLASLMVSFSRNKVDGSVPFINQVLENLDDYNAFSTISLSKVLTSFHKLGMKNSKLTGKLLKETKQRVNQFIPSVLIKAFKALAMLKIYDPTLTKEVIKRCSLQLANLSTIDLANLVYSLSELSYRNVTFLKKLSVCINYQLNDFNNHDLHILFSRLSMLRVSDLDLLTKLADKITAVQHELNEVEKSEIAIAIVYTITHFECLNREISESSGQNTTFYQVPEHFYNLLDHLLSLLEHKMDISTVFRLKTIYLYLQTKPKKFLSMSKKSREVLEKANSVEFSLAEYLLTSSSAHKEISHYLNLIGLTHKNEVQVGPYLIDIVPVCAENVAIEYDGPSHFYVETVMRNIKSILKHEILKSRGWKVIHIPYQEWAQLVDEKQKIIYLNKIRKDILGNNGNVLENNIKNKPVT